MTDGMRKRNNDGDEIALWAGPRAFDEYKGTNMFSCIILDRSDKLHDGNFYNYTVFVEAGETKVEVINVPHRCITFVNEPYTSDIHSPKAFRHWIGLPDVIFPQAWRNRRD
jgi:hypothetical protein